jgi:hypothetical protein
VSLFGKATPMVPPPAAAEATAEATGAAEATADATAEATGAAVAAAGAVVAVLPLQALRMRAPVTMRPASRPVYLRSMLLLLLRRDG